MRIRLSKLQKDKLDTASLVFNSNRCYICKKTGQVFHHLEYLTGERELLKKLKGWKYWNYVKETIYLNPSRFFFLCNKCHWKIERTGIKPSKNIDVCQVERLFFVATLTKT